MAPRWRERRHLARLCDLVAGSLLPHLEPEPPAPQLTREDERRILLALTRVSRVIRGWDVDDDDDDEEDAQGYETDQDILSCSGQVHRCCLPPDQHFDEGSSCLANTASILVALLGFCSDYVKHSAGNILIDISNSLMKFETVWIQFVQLIWAAIHTISTCSQNAVPSTVDSPSCFGKGSIHCSSVVESISCDITTSSTSITSFMSVLKLRCLNICGVMTASLFRVLHTILKFLKLTDCELKGDFVCLSIHHIQNIGWDSYYQINVKVLEGLVKDGTYRLSNDSAQLGMLQGSLLQLMCSLVEQYDLEDTNERDMFVKLVGVIPKLVAFLQEQKDAPKSLSQYSKHKILMVMIRLKPYMQQNCSDVICWLKLLRRHFFGVLHEPMLQHVTKPENCLEGSPFLLSIVGMDEIQDKSTRHFQRQAIYLFLSCCICVAYSGDNNRLQCSCKRDNCVIGHKVQGCGDHCNCFGLSEISDWFQRCCLDETFVSKTTTDIALCFLQLYIEEDDMLFTILLQLLDVPLISLKINSMETNWTSELIGAKLFSTIFDPVHILHLLLLLLHYDHLVLVDYLISKDVGVRCAQYLLRCLRLVFQCWHAFVDDSIYEAKVEKFNCKRQKTLKDINSIRDSSTEAPKLDIDRAKVCLLSLKRTVEDLHKKDLFPYNPKALLRSLTRFEELCEQDRNFSFLGYATVSVVEE